MGFGSVDVLLWEIVTMHRPLHFLIVRLNDAVMFYIVSAMKFVSTVGTRGFGAQRSDDADKRQVFAASLTIKTGKKRCLLENFYAQTHKPTIDDEEKETQTGNEEAAACKTQTYN